MSPEAKAGYRFIPVNKLVVEPPLGFRHISHARPLTEGYCGAIDVTWTAETPICVGAEQEDGSVGPYALGDRYALPGSSIKGMVRSVLEIATYSHLGQINAGHTFGRRKFPNQLPETMRNKELYAGWLIYDQGEWWLAKSTNYRQLEGANSGYCLLGFDKIEALASAANWKPKPIEEKRSILNQATRAEKVWFDAKPDGHGRGRVTGLRFAAQSDIGASHEGYIVCGGGVDPSMNKENETVFLKPDGRTRRLKLDTATMKKFAMLHSRPARSGPRPLGSWQYWLETTGWPEPHGGRPLPGSPSQPGLGDLPGIPIFYCGSAERANDAFGERFFMGLSRVPKVPYKYSVGEVAMRTTGQEEPPYRTPKLEDQIDFARAMFGDVESALDESGEKKDKAEERAALKGRVSCGFALGPHVNGALPVETTVLMGPKASFWPFYLKDGHNPGQTASYDSFSAILAGRKRYPLRPVTDLPSNPTDNQDLETKISFLPQGTVFKGQIRFHNLHPVELGALLWVLTFGEPEGRHRHAMGRAKAYGYGRLHCQAELTAKPNQGREYQSEIHPFVDQFIEYMDLRVSELGLGASWLSSPAVAALLEMADPALGEERRGLLQNMELASFKSIMDQEETLPDDYVGEEGYEALFPNG